MEWTEMEGNKLIWVIFIACGLFSAPVQLANAEGVNVYYGGFAFYGKHADIESHFPYSKRLNDAGETESRFRDFFRKTTSGNCRFNLKFEKADAAHPAADVIAMAITVYREDFSTEVMRDGVKVVFDLGVNIVFLDLASKKFLNSYPINIEFIDLLQAPPDEAYKAKVVREALLGDGKESVFAGLRDAIGVVVPSSSKIRTISVTRYNIAPPASSVLFGGASRNADAYSVLMARNFSDELVRNLGITVVPGGHDALSGKMSLVFADGKEQDFSLPDPTYTIELTLADLQHKELGRTPVEVAHAYGAFLKVKVVEPESGTVYFEKEIIHGASKKVAASSGVFDEKPIYQEVVLLVLKKAVNELGKDKRFQKEVLARCVSG